MLVVRVVGQTVVDSRLDQACFMSRRVTNLPVMSSCNCDIAIVIDKEDTRELRVRCIGGVYATKYLGY